MKKVYLFMVFLALCVALYGLSEVYATISNSAIAANSSEQPARSTSYCKTPNSQPNLRTCGDPIQDPRPRSIRPLISI